MRLNASRETVRSSRSRRKVARGPFACTFGPKKKERRIQDAYKEKVLLAWSAHRPEQKRASGSPPTREEWIDNDVSRRGSFTGSTSRHGYWGERQVPPALHPPGAGACQNHQLILKTSDELQRGVITPRDLEVPLDIC